MQTHIDKMRLTTITATFLILLASLAKETGQTFVMTYARIEQSVERKLGKLGLKNRKAMGVLGAVITLGVAAVALLLIVIVVAQVDANAPTLTGIGNSTYESASTQVYNALNLAPIIMIVLVAGAVLGILIVFAGRGE